MTKKNSNKRKDLRVALQKATATIQQHNTGLFAFLKGDPRATPIINISSEGLRLLSPKKLEKKTKLSLNIAIPLLGTNPVYTYGEVVWSKPFTPFPAYLVGVKFTSIPTGSKKRLNHLVAFLGKKIHNIIKFKKGSSKTIPKACPFCNAGSQVLIRGFTSPTITS